MTSEELNAVETVALARAITDRSIEYKDASSALSPGSQSFDFTVRVKGSFHRKRNYSQRIVAKADPWLLLAAAFSKLNGTTVESLVESALDADPKLVEGLKEKAALAIQELKGPTMTPCNGKITVNLEVEKV